MSRKRSVLRPHRRLLSVARVVACTAAYIAALTGVNALEVRASVPQDTSQSRARLVPTIGHAGWIRSLAVSPDSRYIVTGGDDGTVLLWHTETGAELRRLEGHSGRVNSVAFSAEGDRILSAAADGTAILWDVDGTQIRQYDRSVRAIFSPESGHVITSGPDSAIHVLDIDYGSEVRRLNSYGHIAVSPDERHLAVGTTRPGTLNVPAIWDLHTGLRIRLTLDPRVEGSLHAGGRGRARHWQAVTSVAYSPDGLYVLTGATDSSVYMWEARTGKEVRRFEDARGWTLSVAFSPDGRYVVAATPHAVLLWRTDASMPIQRYEVPDEFIQTATFATGGDLIIAGGESGRPLVWSVAEPRTLVHFGQVAERVHSVMFSPDGRRLLAAGDGGVRMWDVRSTLNVARFETGGLEVTSVFMSETGERVQATVRSDREHLAPLASAAECGTLQRARKSAAGAGPPTGIPLVTLTYCLQVRHTESRWVCSTTSTMSTSCFTHLTPYVLRSRRTDDP
jgi:WD40 repeat protein